MSQKIQFLLLNHTPAKLGLSSLNSPNMAFSVNVVQM